MNKPNNTYDTGSKGTTGDDSSFSVSPNPLPNNTEDKIEQILIDLEVHDQHGLTYHLGSKDVEKATAQLSKLLIQAELEARRDAIKSYKKVNKLHEIAIREDELDMISDQPHSDVLSSYLEKRRKELSAGEGE